MIGALLGALRRPSSDGAVDASLLLACLDLVSRRFENVPFVPWIAVVPPIRARASA